MYYYFDNATHRCIFTSSTPIVLDGATRVEAADEFNDYLLSSIVIKDGEVWVDKDKDFATRLQSSKDLLKQKLDSIERDLDAIEEHSDEDVSEVRKLLSKTRYDLMKTETLPLPEIPNIVNGVLVVEADDVVVDVEVEGIGEEDEITDV